ncbi:MAG: glycosyltransferase family 39 protein [Elusimicrobiota bacterium]|nr:glycosyltransferase family 39 protein [Elusimicrobiota bacterium]
MRKWLFLLLVLLPGIYLRVCGLQWGLPVGKFFHSTMYHPDESGTIEDIADMNPRKLDFRVRLNAFRGTAQIYMTAAWLGLAKVTHAVKIVPSYGYYKENPGEFTKLFVAARSLSVLFGIATILLLFFSGGIFYGSPGTGFLAAFFLAIAPLHAVWSHYIGTDAILTFEVCLLLILSRRGMETGRYYILSGILAGITIATKYSALPVLIIPLTARLLAKKSLFDKPTLFYFCAVAAGFVIGNPYVVIDPGWLISTLRKTIDITVTNTARTGDAFGSVPGIIYYLTTAPKYSLGLPLALLSASGLLYAAFKREKTDLLLLPFILLLLVELSLPPWRLVRWFMPFVPLLCLLAARFVLLSRKRFFLAALAAAVSAYTLFYTASYVRTMATEDVRDASSRWIEENIAENSRIAVPRMFFWNPAILTSLYWFNETEPFRKNIKKYKVLQTPSVQELSAAHPDYVIISDYEYYPALNLKGKYPNPQASELFNKLSGSGDYTLIKKFEKSPSLFGIKPIGGFYPHDWRYPFPTLLVFKAEKDKPAKKR